MTLRQASKIASPILFMITIMIIFPAPAESTSNEVVFYGSAEITKYDPSGNAVYTQIVHNRLVDTGEDFLLDQTFQDSATVADNAQIAVICIFQGTIVVAETETASDFDGDNTLTETNCKEDTAVTTTGSTAVIGPLTFAAGGTNAADGDIIAAIGICQPATGSDADQANCDEEGILFAIVDTTDVTLNTGETVQITYTFDITSAST